MKIIGTNADFPRYQIIQLVVITNVDKVIWPEIKSSANGLVESGSLNRFF